MMMVVFTYVEVIIDRQHRCVATGTQTFDFHHGKFPILGHVSNMQSTKVLLYSLENLISAANHARCRRANLDKVLPDRFPRRAKYTSAARKRTIFFYAPIKHGIKGRDLVHPHRRHLDQLRNIVHDANAGPAIILALAKV